MALLRWLDLVALAVALPVFIFAGLPVSAWLVTAVAWLAQRAVREWAIAKAESSDDPRTLVGLLAGSMIGRGWFVALAIFGCGIVFGSTAGLAAAVLAVSLFTVMFSCEMIARPLGGGS